MLKDRVIFITGAGQGIGKAVAARAVELGARVALVDIDEAALDATVGELGEAARGYVASVTDQEAVTSVVEQAIGDFGYLDGLMNNAGILAPDLIEKMPLAKWQRSIDINLTGVFICTQTVGRHFLQRSKDGAERPGVIVNVSSIAGRRGAIGGINYSAAKAGVLGCTMTTASEWGRFGIRANSICFGLVETRMTENFRANEKFANMARERVALRRFSSPEEVAEPVCFLMSDGAGYITGQHISADGGAHMGY